MPSFLRQARPLHFYIAAAAIGAAFLAYFFLFRQSNDWQTITLAAAPYADRVTISGTTKAAEEVDLGFAASGRISGAYASTGDRVARGTVLAVVENGDLRAELAARQATLASQQAKLDSLRAGTRLESLAVTQSQVAREETALATARTGVADAIRNTYTTIDDAVRNKADQFIIGPRSPNPALSFRTSSKAFGPVMEERAELERLLSAWPVELATLPAQSDTTEASARAARNLAAAAQFLADANLALHAAIADNTVTEADIAGWISDVAAARSNIDAAQSKLSGSETTARNAAAELATARKNLALQSAGSTAQDITAQQSIVNAAAADVSAAAAALEKTRVRAPFDGLVTRMDARVGESVSPADAKISMISGGNFQVELFVPEGSVAGLMIGNTATVTLDAYGADAAFAAQIVSIDPAATDVGGVSSYKTMLQLNDADPRVKSGMTARAVITKRISENALAVPKGAVYEKGGLSLVQVLRSGKPVEIPVAVGNADVVGTVEVRSGLSVGDVIILNPDASS